MYRSEVVKATPPRPSRKPSRAAASGNTILVVSKKTGFGMETLRAWERRHGFPKPERRPGSNRRLYSQADIDRLLAMRRAMQSGYRVGDLVGKSLSELESLAVSSDAVPEAPTPAAAGAVVDVAALLALLARDADRELDDALRAASVLLGPRRFVTEVAHPFAIAVGQAWADGRISIRHEHLATECLTTRLRDVLADHQHLEGGPLVLLATLPGELHTLGLQLVAVYLAVKGARARLLGASTPAREIVEAATSLGADVVGITVTPASDRKDARKAIKAMRAALPKRTAIWVGGAGAGELGVAGPGVSLVTTWDRLDAAVA
ncbi:MAG TPA: cobalamin-dependent protein, partial [Polyangiaceae bacterium]|nr:cobalamin-dependent protein [Polyangiaceae bacterium]